MVRAPVEADPPVPRCPLCGVDLVEGALLDRLDEHFPRCSATRSVAAPEGFRKPSP